MTNNDKLYADAEVGNAMGTHHANRSAKRVKEVLETTWKMTLAVAKIRNP